MRRKSSKKSYYPFFMLVVSAMVVIFPVEASSIKNGINATAISGGNKLEGGGTIETGDARASVEAEVFSNDGENASVKAEARAEADGEAVEIKTEGNGPISIEKENGGARAEVEIKTGEDIDNLGQDNDQETGIMKKIADAVRSFFINLFD